MKKILFSAIALFVTTMAMAQNPLVEMCFEQSNQQGSPAGTTANSSAATTDSYATVTGISGVELKNIYFCKQCIKFGTSSAAGVVTTPAIDFDATKDYTVFVSAASWKGQSNSFNVDFIGTDGTVVATQTVAMESNSGVDTFTDYKLHFTGIPAESKVSIYGSDGSKGYRLWVKRFSVVEGWSENTLDAPVITPATGEYLGSQEMSITAPEGATIYYTTDGTTPSASSEVYAGPFTVSEQTLVKAVAVNGNDFSYASASFINILRSVTIGEFRQLNVDEVAALQFTDAVVQGGTATGYIYVTDATGGICISGSGLALNEAPAGSVLNGYIIGPKKWSTSYNHYFQRSNVDRSNLTITEGTLPTDGVTVTPASFVEAYDAENFYGPYVDNLITVIGYAVANGSNIDIYNDETPAEGAPYIRVHTALYSGAKNDIEAGKCYKITGIGLMYGNNAVPEILPRQASDISTDVTTAISEIATENDSPCYNVLGQRVLNAKGLIIKNGKKVLVK